MNTKITKSALILSLVGLSSGLFAQDANPDTTSNRFSKKDFRTWSIGLNGGMLTPHTIFRGKNNDFSTPTENWGYGG
jgi:OOP family OmpA-OmpF porin